MVRRWQYEGAGLLHQPRGPCSVGPAGQFSEDLAHPRVQTFIQSLLQIATIFKSDVGTSPLIDSQMSRVALVQRPVAFSASYSPFTKGLVISKDTRCLFQHISPMGKQIPNPGCIFQQPMRLSSASHLVDGWLESVFPAAHVAQTVTEVKEVPPEHLNQDDIQQHL